MSNQVQTDIQIKNIFQSLDQSQADFTDILGSLITLNESDILYREGEEADSVYLIIHGEIKFTNQSLIGDEGLTTAKDKEFIGYSEYIESSVRVSTAVATCETFLLKLSNGEIEKLVDKNQALLYCSRNGFLNQEDELWEQWDLLLNGYIFNSPPSVDVIPNKHKHSGNNGNNGQKPDLGTHESENQEIDSKRISEDGSKNGEDIKNRETETPHAGLITQQEIDSTFEGKVREEISVDSFGMIDENKLLENNDNINTSAHSEAESDSENINSKWNSLFEDNKINCSDDEGSVLDSRKGGSAEEIDYPTIDDIISQYKDQLEDSEEEILNSYNNSNESDEISLPIDELEDDNTGYYSPPTESDIVENISENENPTGDKFSELEALFEDDKLESEPTMESGISDTKAADSETNEEIESSWNQLENLMDSAKEEIEIIEAAVPEANPTEENKEPLDLQIEENPLPHSESSSNLYEDEAGFIIEEFKDEGSFDLDDDENTQIMDFANYDVINENSASDVSDVEGIDDIDIIEDNDPFIPEEKNEVQVSEPDVFEIENAETSGLENIDPVIDLSDELTKEENVEGVFDITEELLKEESDAIGIDISDELMEFDISNPSEALDLSDLEETNLSEWDKLNQISEKIEKDPQPDSSGLEIFELDEFVKDPVSDYDEDTAQLQTFNIDDLENEVNETIDLIKEDSDDCELKEIYEEDGVCIMISKEGEETEELKLEKQIESDELKNRKAEILKKKEEEKELLNKLKEPPKVLPSKEWDVINYSVEQNPDLKFQENIFEDIMIVTINLERCTLQYASEFRSYMLSLMSNNTKKIIVDMTYCNFMDSSFLGALVASLKKLKTLKGDLRLVWDDPNHTTMLFLTGMDKIFRIYDNIKEAIFKFSDDV